MKIRIKFAKYGIMRFVGHLDMMRYFQKAMRRADIDIAYSEGYSPHQIMSFAAPLGVGLTSEGEYLDIEVHSSKSDQEALRALNEVMVEGVSVLQYRELPQGTRNAMSSVAAADYLVYWKEGDSGVSAGASDSKSSGLSASAPGSEDSGCPDALSELSRALGEFYQGQEEILITRQTKKGEKTMDLKPLIYELEAVDVKDFGTAHKPDGAPEEERLLPGQGVGFFMKVCTGSTDNVKPELVLSAFSDYCEATGACTFRFEPFRMQIHRVEVYARESGEFIPLGEI